MSITAEQATQATKMAEEMANDFDPQQAEEFAEQHQDKPWYSDFALLFRMLTTEGFHLSQSTWLIIAGALAYVIFPIDVIPDFIPFLGWLDDAAVLTAVMAKVAGEAQRFREFEESGDSKGGI